MECRGRQFFAIYNKTEEFYGAVAEEIDAMAERILMLGQRPSASLATYLSKAKLKEADSAAIGSAEVAKNLLADFQTLVRGLRAGVEAG